MARKKKPPPCKLVSLRDALKVFVRAESGHKGQEHIRPLHWYVACRLVLEGGFLPEEITPRPPFVAERRAGRRFLTHDPKAGGAGERTVLGGLKTKAIDVVVSKPNIGPCIAVSLKGTLNAFRNLTNRLEEAAGDCTNLHMVYPALVRLLEPHSGQSTRSHSSRRHSHFEAGREGGGEESNPSQRSGPASRRPRSQPDHPVRTGFGRPGRTGWCARRRIEIRGRGNDAGGPQS